MATNEEKAAEKCLRDAGQTKAPVDVERVAESLGLRIEQADLDEDCSGLLVRKDSGDAVIGVNWAHHPNRQRFTIAHEIGHYKLHTGGTYVDKGTFARFRDENSGSGTVKEEREANRFAAALLMPEAWVREAFANRPPDDRVIEELASEYGVSTQAMTFRLANLRLLRL